MKQVEDTSALTHPMHTHLTPNSAPSLFSPRHSAPLAAVPGRHGPAKPGVGESAAPRAVLRPGRRVSWL